LGGPPPDGFRDGNEETVITILSFFWTF
jgi:hypothetical protein